MFIYLFKIKVSLKEYSENSIDSTCGIMLITTKNNLHKFTLKNKHLGYNGAYNGSEWGHKHQNIHCFNSISRIHKPYAY